MLALTSKYEIHSQKPNQIEPKTKTLNKKITELQIELFMHEESIFAINHHQRFSVPAIPVRQAACHHPSAANGSPLYHSDDTML